MTAKRPRPPQPLFREMAPATFRNWRAIDQGGLTLQDCMGAHMGVALHIAENAIALSPSEARRLAWQLSQLADRAEGK